MLKPGNLLYCGGFYITFIHTQLDNLGLLGSRGPDDVNGLDYLQFQTTPDGLLPAFDQNGTQDISVLCGFISRPIPCFPFQRVQIKLDGASNVARVTCVVWSFPTVAAEELGAPGLAFLVMSASIAFGSLDFCKLVERGFISLKGTMQSSVSHSYKLLSISEDLKKNLFLLFLAFSAEIEM